MNAYEMVLNFMNTQEKPVNAGKIVEATGLDRKDVDAVMKKMKTEGTIVSPVRCMWEVKK